ncbi:hypothetical protein NDU88_009709 [Pleurodeles waltl]|uniref:Uncharacterized protein n=1 Tax=Pleurodeles waltl TaxID=8319 RepID=A0AAV7QTS6_PLEWA|nr:hypothetical protein NDU88_009709 [Pleurodeles waltl]
MDRKKALRAAATRQSAKTAGETSKDESDRQDRSSDSDSHLTDGVSALTPQTADNLASMVWASSNRGLALGCGSWELLVTFQFAPVGLNVLEMKETHVGGGKIWCELEGF